MKKMICAGVLLSLFIVGSAFGQAPPEKTTKVILLISEQNIEGPQRGWWASEVDLSSLEATVATALIGQGIEVLEPSALEQVVKKSAAFRTVNMSQSASVKLGNLAKADFVVLGKAVASAGGNVSTSNMRSCFANVTAKLIRVKDGKVVAYLNAKGKSVHTDMISGGQEALVSAGEELSGKIIAALQK